MSSKDSISGDRGASWDFCRALAGSFALLVCGSACGSAPDSASGGGGPDAFGTGGGPSGKAGRGGFAGGAGAAGSGGIIGGSPGDPAQLTAADWDDNAHFGTYQRHLDSVAPTVSYGATRNSSDRIVVQLATKDGTPMAGAMVTITGVTATHLVAPSGADGRLLFFPAHDGVPLGTTKLSVSVSPPKPWPADPAAPPAPNQSFTVSLADREWSLTLDTALAGRPKALDLAVVLDATANTADPLGYLAERLTRLVDPATLLSERIDARFAAVLYRDEGDDYVTRSHDFSEDLNQLGSVLSAETSEGGGDYPEAIDAALENLLVLSWRPGNVTRLAFVVIDAPPHEPRAAALLAHIEEARRAGIRIYPVATRNVDSVYYFAREAAAWTLGQFIFTTNELAPSMPGATGPVPCYQVRYLDAVLMRLIRSELGAPNFDDPNTILRAVPPGGAGACTAT